MRSFPPRLRALAAVAIFGATLAGCGTFRDEARHLDPLPAALIAQMEAKGMRQDGEILVRIFKKESELEVWKKDRSGRFALLKTYAICRWSGQLGPKTRSGDRQAPEGFYHVTPAMMNPKSQFYLSFNLGYPNPLEKAQGHTGEALMVHGACSSSGCFAMTDEGVTEIYGLAREAFKGGQKAFQVQAFPFRMNARNLAAHRNDPNMPFWMNLKDGYAYFQREKLEPSVAACDRRYVFNARPVDPSMPFDPLAPCPAYEVDPAFASSIAAFDAQLSAGLAGAQPASAVTYRDGGMHASYRDLLRKVGPERLSKITSNTRVAVSRPDEALTDSYRHD